MNHDILIAQGRMPKAKYPPRCGYSLIELMVVMMIIGILVSLLTATVIGVIAKARETVIKAEIDNLHVAMEFYNTNNGSYPPNLQDLDAVEAHIKKRFPRCKDAMPKPYAQTGPAVPPSIVFVATATSTTASNFSSPEEWEISASSQGLVFWLSGFYPDPEHPLRPPEASNSTAGAPKYVMEFPRVPLFEFNTSRLRQTGTLYRANTIVTDPRQMVPFANYYPPGIDTPYVYFDSRGTSMSNSYTYPQRLANGTKDGVKTAVVRYFGGGIGTTLTKDRGRGMAVPYKVDPPTGTTIATAPFVNSKSFQILCAGEDNTWSAMPVGVPSATAAVLADTDFYAVGTRGLWTFPSGTVPAATAANPTDEHRDNLANFAKGTLADAPPLTGA